MRIGSNPTAPGAPRLIPVILAGGMGTRLWPVSRPSYPKPLIRLTGDRSLIQETVLRAAAIPGIGKPVVVCGVAHFPPIADQLAEIEQPLQTALLEPVGRGTAPAAAAAALAAHPDDILIVMPADHLVEDLAAFTRAVDLAAEAAGDGWLVTFGVVPDRAETGYGYIEAGAPVDEGACALRIVAFREKPDPATARRYFESGRYSWNSGMFVFRAGAYLDELQQSDPEMVRMVSAALAIPLDRERQPDGRAIELDHASFAACPPGSIDRTVMERTRRGAMVPLEAGWSDVGSWRSLWEVGRKDGRGNVVAGPSRLEDVSSSYIRATDRPVVVIGLDDVIVVDDGQAVLVASTAHAQQVRPFGEVDPHQPAAPAG